MEKSPNGLMGGRKIVNGPVAKYAHKKTTSTIPKGLG
jgi:hypothetical protein